MVDPGHNSGNFSHVWQINRHYWVGLDKACNTTGTETRSGYLEAEYTFDVAQRLIRLLREAGARVVVTRDRDGQSTYGPCIQARGLLAGQVGADIGVSIHADGGPSWGRGAFVYTPSRLTGYTSAEKARASVQLGRAIIVGLEGKGLRRSTYIAAVDPDRMQGTLNVSTVPIVIVETLNMANASDAAIAESRWGRQRVAEGVFDGVVAYFR
jgi:N-acetylmuramoyl-L-alanine amidase